MGRLDDEGQSESVPHVPGLKPGTKGVRLDRLREMAFELGLKKAEEPAADATKTERTRWLNTRRKAFQRAVEDLTTARKVRQEGDWIWLL
jgi:hypothetical protein